MSGKKKSGGGAVATLTREESIGGTTRAKLVTVPSNIVIRQMELRDVSAAFHLGEASFKSSGFPQLYRTWGPLEVTDSLGSDPELCLVAEQVTAAKKGKAANGSASTGGKIVAFILGNITEKRRKEQSCGYLSWVAVAESHQRLNIGTRLVQQMFKLFADEEIRTVICDTPQENTPAIRFMGRLGFADPVYHIYTSLNVSTHQRERVAGPRVVLSAEAKTVKIREMTIDDLSAVHELGDHIYRADLYPNLFRIWSEAEVVELFGSDQEHCFVAEQGGKVVGFCLGTIIEKERNSWRYGYLIWLGVSPDVQRLGVGRRLYEEFYSLMREKGCRIIMVDTQADNEPARRFFERAGFGSVEKHVYFSLNLTTDHIPAELLDDAGHRGEAGGVLNRNGSLTAAAAKAFRLFKYKRGHSIDSGSRHTFGGGEASGIADATSGMAVVEEEEEEEDKKPAAKTEGGRKRKGAEAEGAKDGKKSKGKQEEKEEKGNGKGKQAEKEEKGKGKAKQVEKEEKGKGKAKQVEKEEKGKGKAKQEPKKEASNGRRESSRLKG